MTFISVAQVFGAILLLWVGMAVGLKLSSYTGDGFKDILKYSLGYVSFVISVLGATVLLVSAMAMSLPH